MSHEQLTKMKQAKGQAICERTRAYALRIIRLYKSLRPDDVGRVLGKQLWIFRNSRGYPEINFRAKNKSRLQIGLSYQLEL